MVSSSLRGAPRMRLLCALVASCFAAEGLANPTGPAVVSGTASFSSVGKTLTVTNSPNAIINWQGFSIGAGEATRFQQQGAASSVLNRIVGQDPSVILGTLWSNGRVFLVNPNGVLFGQGSRLDVAGLVASTLNISDRDFLAGRLNFQAGAIAGSIVNQGEIVSASGGRIYLIAPDVQNHGLISSPGGEVLLAAGRTVSLVDADVPNLKVEVQAGGEALNVGKILADGGKAGIYAGLINQRGVVRADSVSKDATGKIVFKASDTTILDDASVTSATGAKGGEIQVLGNKVGLVGSAKVDASGVAGGGTVLIGGDYQGKNDEIQNAYRTYVGPQSSVTADAITTGDGGKVIVWSDDATRAYGSLSAKGGAQSGNGGFVEVSGKSWLDFNASVNTSAPKGAAGALLLDPAQVNIVAQGSESIVGGAGFDGGNPNIFNGGSGASSIGWTTIKNHLTGAGGGSNTNVYITTSGSQFSCSSPPGSCGIDILAASGDLTASNSLRLISHNHINVSGSITNTGSGALELYAGWDGTSSTASPSLNSSFGTIALNAPISFAGDVSLRSSGSMTLAAPISAGGNVLIDAQGALANVSVTANIASTAAGASSLQIKAANTIDFSSSADITATGPLQITLNSDSDASGAGRISLGSGSVLTSNGGNVTLGGGLNPLTTYAVGDGPSGGSQIGVHLSGATIGAGTGNISIRGKGAAGTTLAAGVELDTGSILGTTSGNITIDGIGGAGTLGGRNWGILLTDGGTKINSNGNGTIALTGQGGSSTGLAASPVIDGRNRGIELFAGAQIVNIGTGNIFLTGTGGSSVDMGSNTGVLISSAGTTVATVTGNITIVGQGGTTTSGTATSTANRGVAIGGATVQSTNTGSVSITGTGGTTNNNSPTSSNSGILVQGDDAAGLMGSVTSGGGNVSLTGTAGTSTAPASHEGMIIANRATVQASGSGTLTLNGTAAAGNPAISLAGGGGTVAPMTVHVEGGTLNVTANGGLLKLETLGGTLNNEFVELVSGGNQTISAGGIVLIGGATGTNNWIELAAGGTQTINAGASGISMTAGGGTTTGNYAVIYAQGNQSITVNGGNIVLQGGSSQGSGFPDTFTGGSHAYIRGDGATQQVTVTGGSISATGGTVGSNNDAGIYSASASQTVSATGGITLIAGASGGGTNQGNAAIIRTEGGAQSVTTAGNISVVGGADGNENQGAIFSAGTQSVTATGSISITGGAGGTNNLASVAATGTQSVSAASIAMTGGSGGNTNVATLNQNSTTANQTVTTTAGGITLLGGSGGSSNLARIRNEGPLQTINAASGASLTAGSGIGGDTSNFARFQSTNGNQNITVGSAGISLTGGSGAVANSEALVTAAGTQAITVSGGGNVTLTGGSGTGNSDYARIFSSGSAQSLVFSSGGNLVLTGGTVGNLNFADIQAGNGTVGAQTQTISGATGISLTGGASGGGVDSSNNVLGNFARINNTNGSQSISAGSGGIALTGGGGSLTSNYALIIQGQSTGAVGTTQAVTINNGGALTLQGGSTAQTNVINNSGNFFRGSYAMVQANGDSQLISFPSGGSMQLTGGTVGSNNVAQILSRFGLQTVSGAPSITLQGGTGGYVDVATNKNEGNYANLNSNAGQSITASAISITGGASGVGNHAQIFDTGTSTAQTITATTISMQGGAGGGADAGTGVSSFGNYANIQATGTGTQSITATGLSLQAGAGGQENFAVITAPMQQTTVHGNLSLTGGGAIAGTLRGGGARIGGPGGSAPAPTNLTLTVDGSVTMTGGSVADAGTGIGSNNQGGQQTTITMSVGNSVTLNPGTVANAGSRIGSPASNIAGGNISITAGGTLALNSSGPGLGTAIRTLGNVTITAGAMTQGPDSQIIAGGTTTLNGGSISLTSTSNDFTGAVSLNSSGSNSVAITDANGIVLGASSLGTGSLTVTAGGTITQTGPIVQAAGAGQATFDAGSNPITLTNAGNDFTGAVDIATTSTAAITDANAFIIKGGGGGGSNASSFTLNANGPVTQSAAFAGIAPTVIVINAGSGPITLNNASNNFSGNTSVSVNTTGAVSALNNNSAGFNLGTSSVGGALTLTSGGPVTQSGPVTVGGVSTVSAGSNPITLANASNDFIGAVNLAGSNVSITDANTIILGASVVSGSLNINASSVTFQGGFSANNYSFSGGTYALTAGNYNLGGTTTVAQNSVTGALTVVDVQSGATINTSGGNINVGTGGTLGVASGATINTSSGLSVGTVNVGSGGTLKGSGTVIANVNNTGSDPNNPSIVSPGNSIGTLTIRGNYVQGSNGRLDMEIAGTPSGTQHDQLVVIGNATVAGTLNTTFTGATLPAGTSVDLISIDTVGAPTGTITGTFTTVNQPVGMLFNSFYGLTTFELIAASSGSVPVEILPPFQNVIVSTDQVLTSLIQTTTTASETGLKFVPGGNIDVAPAPETTLTTAEGKIVPKPPACN